ncbi:MAG: integrating conjugative element protein, partial [Gammaproteobacteria bacterium]|nr:integrating conjugative element protein [Gammaproteobacteria bacterium]
HDWKVAMGLPGSDVVRAKQQVEQANGSNGVPWIGGQAGGQHQAPLRFTGDIVAAGYNLHLNRPLTATDPVPVTDTTRLGAIWASPQAARDWAVDVVGENIATTCDTCRKDSIPGAGLLPKLYEESDTVAAQLKRLVDGTAPPTREELDRISAPGVVITRQVVEAIRDMPNTEQPLIMHRLVAEISAARTIEKALYARRLLLTGRQVPEVYATTVAREHAEAAVTELDREIDNLLFETRVRREVVSDTVAVLLQRAAARRQSSLQVPQVSPVDPRPLNRGRVQ